MKDIDFEMAGLNMGIDDSLDFTEFDKLVEGLEVNGFNYSVSELWVVNRLSFMTKIIMNCGMQLFTNTAMDTKKDYLKLWDLQSHQSIPMMMFMVV